MENNHSSVIVTSRIVIVHSFESSSRPLRRPSSPLGEVSSGISTVRDREADPIPYHTIHRSIVRPIDRRRRPSRRTTRSNGANGANGASCKFASLTHPPPVVAVASRRVASRLVSHLVDRTRARSRSPRLARPPPPSSSSVPRRTPTTPARRIARINSPALARLASSSSSSTSRAPRLRRRAPRPRSSRRAPRGRGGGFRV